MKKEHKGLLLIALPVKASAIPKEMRKGKTKSAKKLPKLVKAR